MEDTGCGIEQAMEKVYKSPLMEALQDEENELYVQSPAYLYELMKGHCEPYETNIRNLKYMRQFADEYPDFPFEQVPLAQLQEKPFLQTRLANSRPSGNDASPRYSRISNQ
jgi:hypothetical protein